MDKIADLADRYPHLTFGNLRFGIECGDGWADIIHAFLATAEQVTAASGGTLHLLQVKEKMGGLRICYRMADPAQRDWMGIDEVYYLAEARSFHVCEHCGRRGVLTYNGLAAQLSSRSTFIYLGSRPLTSLDNGGQEVRKGLGKIQ